MEFTVLKDELPVFAKTFWRRIEQQKVFLFYGEMGAGKTTIIEALCYEKGVKERMSSPTFSIINQYNFEDGGKEKTIYHMDLYRLKDEQEIIQAGVEDCLYSGEICFVEWPEKAPGIFDNNAAKIFIEAIDETQRRVKINLP